MRRYSLTATDTNTAGTTMWTLGSATTIRPALYDFIPSSVATPADNAMQCDLKRCTALGTSTAVTAVELDPGDPASLTTNGENHTVEPTYTANKELLQICVNMRATFRWVAREGSEIKAPATAANGLGCFVPTIGGSAVVYFFTILFSE